MLLVAEEVLLWHLLTMKDTFGLLLMLDIVCQTLSLHFLFYFVQVLLVTVITFCRLQWTTTDNTTGSDRPQPSQWDVLSRPDILHDSLLSEQPVQFFSWYLNFCKERNSIYVIVCFLLALLLGVGFKIEADNHKVTLNRRKRTNIILNRFHSFCLFLPGTWLIKWIWESHFEASGVLKILDCAAVQPISLTEVQANSLQ